MNKIIYIAVFATLVVLIFEYLFDSSLIKLFIQIPILITGIFVIYIIGNQSNK